MRKIAALGLSIMVIIFVLAACSAAPSTGTTTLNIKMAEFKYEPDAWTVTAGQPVTVNLDNTGTLSHTWTIMKTPISGNYTDADKSDIYFSSPVVASGTSTTISFTAPSTPGKYQVICTQPGHFEAGMVGQLTVK